MQQRCMRSALDPADLLAAVRLAQAHKQGVRFADAAGAGSEPFRALAARQAARRIAERSTSASSASASRQAQCLGPAEARAGFPERKPQVARRLFRRDDSTSSSVEAPPAARSSSRASRAISTSCDVEIRSPKKPAPFPAAGASSKISVLQQAGNGAAFFGKRISTSQLVEIARDARLELRAAGGA